MGAKKSKIKHYDHTKTQHHRRKENIANKKIFFCLLLLLLKMSEEEKIFCKFHLIIFNRITRNFLFYKNREENRLDKSNVHSHTIQF